jgi:nucleoid DNA-binding protein
MKQSALIRRLARATGVTPAAAADQLDHIVAQIVGRLRRGKSARIPGLGTFPPGDRCHFDFSSKDRTTGKVPQ